MARTDLNLRERRAIDDMLNADELNEQLLRTDSMRRTEADEE